MSNKVRVLVIDDERDIREAICENLEMGGFETIQASDGEKGMAMIDPGNPPAVLITDIIMPQQEGLETITKIKKIYPAIKIIAISGGGRTHSMDFLYAAKKLGADTALPKPFDMDKLESIVRSFSQ